ncbi:DEAD/DEAH box helicase [Streptomyces sp. COG20]|uniref:DEAD/DEAH box helicase n=1 Tax=Streptomyces sp. COG20 TaxID=2838871 RepID=UPI0035A90143
MVTRPPDILITTPESLFLMLTSSARDALAGVETVILDEVHAVAGTKRGAHLALSLERLDELLPRPARRIGLSATVRRSGRWPASCRRSARWRSSSRPPPRSSTCRWSSRSRIWASWEVPRPPTGTPPRRRSPRSGRMWRSASRISSRHTAPPSSSPTPGGWPSGCATG